MFWLPPKSNPIRIVIYSSARLIWNSSLVVVLMRSPLYSRLEWRRWRLARLKRWQKLYNELDNLSFPLTSLIERMYIIIIAVNESYNLGDESIFDRFFRPTVLSELKRSFSYFNFILSVTLIYFCLISAGYDSRAFPP